ncbi:MAG: serine/threonine protein kinase [Bryobacterales bacterium]|nr:serine/threonine protein kinase [Bryobacterales bacterium]
MLQTETRLGDYEILDIVQSSRKEVVYRVRNRVANRVEAMKVLPDSLERDNEARERFFREIKVLARLVHPNIVAFHNAAEIGGKIVMTTELLEGVTLADRMEVTRLPVQEACVILQQVLAALGHAHSQGVVHREVTPDNVWLLPGGMAKLGGFALAKGKGDLNLTQEGTSLGTVHYMAPEQVKGTSSVDFRADIYAAGCLMYELLTGKKPFEAKSQFDVMLAHVQREATPAVVVNPAIPAALQMVISTAMQKDPAHRYPNAYAMGTAIQEALHGRPEKVRDAAAPAPVAAPPAASPGPAAPEPVPASGAPPPSALVEGMVTYLAFATLAAAIVWVVMFLAK